MADRVVVLKEGKIEKTGTPTAVFFKEQETNNFKVTGKVLEIQSNGTEIKAIVKVGADLFSIPITNHQLSAISVGKHILLSSKELMVD